jgi:Protein of unknown function (DUF3500)
MRVFLMILIFLGTETLAQKNDLKNKANSFLATLSPPLKAKAQYTLSDDERLNWHFVPKSRNGVSFRDFSPSQTDAALAFLKASLSTQGFQKAADIMALENILREVEHRGANDNFRDPLNYYLTIFDIPDDAKPWGWRFEGHHIALNFTSLNSKIESSTPSFFGSNPGTVLQGKEKGKQVLKQETDLGFRLVNSLTPEQLKAALISEVPLDEIVSFNSRKAVPLAPLGLAFADMNDTQKDLLTKLLEVYVNNYELGFAHKLMEKIKKTGIEKLTFAWAGSLIAGSGYYYRRQGPMLLIELDNTQNNANHVHSVVRDLTNDFGEDILRDHYEKEHSNNSHK